MRSTNLLADSKAASSAIGTILMVGVVIILSTTTGVYLLDVSDRISNDIPTASFEYSTDACGAIEVTHTGGPTIDGDQLYFGGAATQYTTPRSVPGWNATSVKSGDSVTVSATPGEELTLIWQAEDGDSSAVISRYDVPSGAAATSANVEIDNINFPGQSVTFRVTSLRNADGPLRATVFEDGVADTTVTVSNPPPSKVRERNPDLELDSGDKMKVSLKPANNQACILDSDTMTAP